jgi:ATP-dependent exoDNAse (exonuclease V) beta subunit
MSSAQAKSAPPDQLQREKALDAGRSCLVQAPAGSGKTTLLTERFLRLLAEVDEPGQVVAITFTNAAAAEMRNRILDELRKDEPSPLARRALEHSQEMGWKLLDLPTQLRISTIDSFCRDLALQQPLLSGLGGGLDIAELPRDLYRRAARKTLEEIGKDDALLTRAIEDLLLWRDNNWQELEELLVEMLGVRDRWMHGFVLEREQDWEELRERLEQPFCRAVREALTDVCGMLGQVPGACEEALELARFACTQTGGEQHRDVAELAEFPTGPFDGMEELQAAHGAHLCLAALLLTGDGSFRKALDKRLGFPADRKAEKARLLALITSLGAIPGLEAALTSVRSLPPARYSEDEWRIVRACFTLLRHAAGQLKVVFAEAGAVDFIEVAQIAQSVLQGADGLPTDAALAVSDGIRHLLVDEFQDTSRRQHMLLASLIAAWPERTGRTCFAVGDPMQSIYFFRDADAELFPRVRDLGLEIPNAEPFALDFVPLKANFRTAPSLVSQLNEVFTKVFAANDGSGVNFSAAEAAREKPERNDPSFKLHLKFVPQDSNKSTDLEAVGEKGEARGEQIQEVVALVESHGSRIEEARARGGDAKYRVAVLGRTRAALAPIAEALRQASIPFRAVDLEQLSARPEVLDAVGLAHALLNPYDRVAWLGVLRAPWCGLALDDLHRLTSNDDRELLTRPVPELLAERLLLLSEAGRQAAERVLGVVQSVPALRAAQPTASVGTWLEQVWLRLGGADCVDATSRANLDLLWSCLDRLPAGEQDLLGPGLDAALAKLTALPDPETSNECGVQLMTIHKAKGLEFEVVIVPDLQAGTGNGGRKMLSWLERGRAKTDDSGEITEFLIAPLQRKGDDKGTAKAWVDRVYRERESQETRRILYVAATRAREELHLFARPAYKVDKNGELGLQEPKNSLLATAWPALEEEVRRQFDEWEAAEGRMESEIQTIAASGESNLLIMPSPAKPTLLRGLPLDYRTEYGESVSENGGDPALTGIGASRLYERHEGGLLSRALGTAVHGLLEELSRLRMTLDWDAARGALARLEPRIAAQVRAWGLDQAHAKPVAAEALEIALEASREAMGKWILSPHKEAASEVDWAGVVGGGLRTVRVDRVFQAGSVPGSEEEDCWWIVDYKTAHTDDVDPAAALPGLRRIFAPQIEAYAAVLRNLHGKGACLRAGLYYPRMLLLDWWEL